MLHAVGHHRHELAPNAVIRYVTSEQFFNEFINGIRRKRMDEFKERYRTIDVLLLDDVQFFEGKEQILEEFFHTFNELYNAGKPKKKSTRRSRRSKSGKEEEQVATAKVEKAEEEVMAEATEAEAEAPEAETEAKAEEAPETKKETQAEAPEEEAPSAEASKEEDEEKKDDADA